jgi:hypothetical protein
MIHLQYLNRQYRLVIQKLSKSGNDENLRDGHAAHCLASCMRGALRSQELDATRSYSRPGGQQPASCF